MSITLWLLVGGFALGASTFALAWRWRGGWVMGLAAGIVFAVIVVAGILGIRGVPELVPGRGLVDRLSMILAVASVVGLPLLGRILRSRGRDAERKSIAASGG